MKTQNPMIDNLIDVQTQTVNNWMDSAKKFQNAMMGGSIATEGQTIYKDWMEKQQTLFNGMQEKAGINADFSKPEEFFKNWYNNQLENTKKMTDFNQSIYNSFSSFGKSSQDYANNFNNINSAWTGVYNNWMNTLNNSYDTFSKNIPNLTNKEAFKNFFDANTTYLKLQEFWAPAFNAFQKGDFSAETFKTYFNPEAYKKVTEQVYGSFFNAENTKAAMDKAMANITEYFTNNSATSKEFLAQMENFKTQFPQFMGGDFAKLTEMYKNVNDVFAKTFEPVMKLVAPGKEKSDLEANIALLDRVAEFSVKQSQLQYQFYTTSQKAMENAAKATFEKLQNVKPNEIQGYNEFYNEWVKINETLFTELFSSDEFSKIKGEVTNVGMDVKKTFEKQFESMYNVYPVVFKSEVEELHKTIYELKKQVKALETKIAINNAATVELEEEEKTAKRKK